MGVCLACALDSVDVRSLQTLHQDFPDALARRNSLTDVSALRATRQSMYVCADVAKGAAELHYLNLDGI